MLQQKQGARVRISSHEKVINMSEVYIPCDSICSCQECDSVDCFNVRNINSGIPCSCTDCDPNRCFTWEIKRYDESKPNNETRNMNVSPEIFKDLLNVPEATMKNSTSDTRKYTERLINTTNNAKKEKISISYLGNDLQTNTSDDLELKEVFTKEEKLKEKCGAIKNHIENKNKDDFYLKDASSNENSDIIECGASHLLKNHSNDPEIIKAKDGSDTKICCSKNKSPEVQNARDHETQQNNEAKNKQQSSKISMPLPNANQSMNNCCRQKITTCNVKSGFPEAYQIFTNEKKNVVKYCNISKDLEKKNADASENKQDNPECNIKYSKESKDYKKSTTESNLKINTRVKIINTNCNYEHPIKDKISDLDFGNYTKYTYKDVSHTRNKINMNKNNKSYEKYVSRLQSVAISYARPEYQNSRAELSAQIMNVPYQNFKESLSRKQSPTESNTCSYPMESNNYSSTNLEKDDIFTRLKEIYKACSCKVCECITGKSLFNRSDICKCRPCDCDDCNGYMAKLKNRIYNAPHSGCPCVHCDRKDCRGVVRSTSDYIACDCKPCDCVRCAESFTKPCTCIPCQCESCKTSIFMPQHLLVANAAESFQHSNCDCEPCECTKCTSRYSAMTSNLMREVSTGIVAHGNCNCEDCSNNTCQLGRSDCRCDSQNKVMQKPMAENKPDYGIHRVYIKDNKYNKETTTNNNHNTITMLALSNNYPNKLFNYSNNKKSCECDVCECIVCKDKGKGSVTNKSLKKPNWNINKNNLNSSECSLRPCQSCESVHTENIEQKNVETRYEACNSTSRKRVGYHFKIINSNENFKFKQVKPTYSTFENKCSPECKDLVKVHSQNSTDTDDGYLYDNDKCYRLKRGTLLTPSMFQYNGLSSYSSHKHIKPEKDGIIENDLQKNRLSNENNTKLCRSKSQHNYFVKDCNEDIINATPESATEVISTNNLLLNMLLKEVGTKEIYKTNSVDFKKGNVSKIFLEHSKNNVENDDINTKLLDAGVTHMTSKPSSHCNKKLEYNKNMIKCSQTSLLDKKVDDFYDITMASSNTDIHFSSAKSMSLVELMCKERNLNIDKKNTRTLLQSLEKIPLKRLKMDEENVSYTCDKSLNDGIFLGTFTNDNYSYSTHNNIPNKMDEEKLNTLNDEEKKFETNLTEKKMDNYYIHGKSIVHVPLSKTTKQIKPKEKSYFHLVERKPNNYNIKAKGSVAQTKINRPRSKPKVANTYLKSETVTHPEDSNNKFNNKRYLEIPDVINTAASAINFTESDKCIDFEKSLNLLREVNYNYEENKKASPILRKNFFITPEVTKNKAMCSIPLLQLDIKNAVKSTNTTFPYCGLSFGNKALTKLRSEVNELLYSPLLQSSQTISQRETSWSKAEFNSEIHCSMSDATSQTKRKTIAVDKEINCNMFESKDNLRQSIQNLINTTLTNVVQCTDFGTRKQNLIRDFNKVSSLNASKSSCGGLRASFVGLRKVSDHSVLLKWAMPRALNNIQGYELQVDGRPVKKILNPSRCMAVLTCLPHCEKLLLTIRTITNLETCQSPVTTIVYNPKKNKSGL